MLLLHRGADARAANPRGTPLHVAAERAHPDVVSVLLRQGADVCPAVLACIFSRIYSDEVDHFAILQPNKVANGVFTPLVSSLVGGSLKCMKLLILVLCYTVFC
jgi:ankyrin repeat protein